MTLALIDNGRVVKLLKPRTTSSTGKPAVLSLFLLTLLMVTLSQVLANVMVFALSLARTASSFFPITFPDPRLSVPFSIPVDQHIHHWQAEQLGCTTMPLRIPSATMLASSLR